MPVRRTSVAIAAIAAAGLVPAIGSAADAAGHGHGSAHAAHSGAAQTRQLHHQIAGLDKRLLRIEGSRALAGLSDDTEQAVDANIENDRATLAVLDGSVDAMSPADARSARQQLHGFHVDNYVRVVGILRDAEQLSADAASVPSAQAALDAAVAAALGITANSPRSATRDARGSLDEANQDIDDSSGSGDDLTA